MSRIKLNRARITWVLKMSTVAGAMALAAAGCSTMGSPADPPPGAAQTAGAKTAALAPDVNDCGLVTISTPTVYACDGKVYTVYQLQHLREQAAAEKAGG